MCKTCGYTLSYKLVQNKCPYCAYYQNINAVMRKAGSMSVPHTPKGDGTGLKVTLPKQRVITPTYNSKGKLK